FAPDVVTRLLDSRHDISIVVDTDWRGCYLGRTDHPVAEAENVVLDSQGTMHRVGKNLSGQIDGEFIGMMKFTPAGVQLFRESYKRAKALFSGRPFQQAPVFHKAYLTDMLQEMRDCGVTIHCVFIKRGWKEIDTVQDYERALQQLADASSGGNE